MVQCFIVLVIDRYSHLAFFFLFTLVFCLLKNIRNKQPLKTS